MTEINVLKANILELKKSLSDMEGCFNNASQDLDKAIEALNLRIDEAF